MSPALLAKVTAHMLDMAADRFSNHTCTDFDAVKELDLTKEEKAEFVAWLREDPDLDDDDRKHTRAFTQNWIVMRLLERHYLSLASVETANP